MAVPSSGAISLAGIRAELATNTYDDTATTQSSLLECSNGTVATINTSNEPGNRPDGDVPHEMSEFYAYDHDLSQFSDNKSFDLDGTNDFLHISSGSFGGSLETTGSVSMWVKIDSHSANGVMWQITAEEGTSNQIFILYHNAAGVIRGNVKLGGTSNIVNSATELEADNNYHHVVMTWNSGTKTSSNNIVKLYIDGSQADTDAIGNTWNDPSPPAQALFGKNVIQNNAFFNGHLNDMAIFSDVLSASEVTAIYNSGSPKDESSHSGLLAYYTLEAYTDGDTTVADDSGNSKTLTINNSTNIDSSDTP
tara:strand:+ start:68 stop:991 length:924 start_codon:yes stop_codon:yes gene_type:complete